MNRTTFASDRTNKVGTSQKVEQFASIVDTGAEISGIYFGKDPKTPQYPAPDKELADGTWKISRG